MRRTSILLDPGLLAELERIARREGRPTSQVIREALQGYVDAQRGQERPLPGFVGIARGPVEEAGDETPAPKPAPGDEPEEGS